MKLRKSDLKLYAVILIIAAAAFIWYFSDNEAGSGVLVRVEGEEVARYPLSQNGTYTLNGGTNTLVIENGKASMTWADCPDKICVNHSAISRTGECITCLPNKLTVTVYGGEDSGVDFVVG